MADRMQTHEAAALVRQWATEGEIDRADQGRALVELERLLVERAQLRWHLDRMAGPWREVRAVLDELADVAGEGAPTSPSGVGPSRPPGRP